MKTRFIALMLLALGGAIGWFNLAPIYMPGTFADKLPFVLGLDLKGGAHLVYKAHVEDLASGNISESMEGLRDVIERRVNMFGVSEPLVQVEGRDRDRRLIVELAGVSNVADAIAMIGATPYLEFKKERPAEERDALLAKQKAGQTLLDDPYFITTELTGKYLKKATLEFDNTTFEPVVGLEFNDTGRQMFADLTKANVGKRVAIYLDGAPVSAPTVREEITGGKAQISGRFTPDEAKALVRNLNAGALPIKIDLISQETVGASLGADALNRGVTAGIYGVLLVALFLILRYRALGLLAVLALGIYIAIVLGIFKLLPVTVTAAGIAGFILSIGVAVDANILVFERFREEIASGKSLKVALEEGFQRGWTSIRDSNISSLISASILYWFSTSLIKGFAFTLGIGIVVSLFSALVVTKTFITAFSVRRVGKIASVLFGTGLKNLPVEHN
ncbi:MAG: protein translocase subunit SecD [Candidatus Niyogibacteria bacterium]|nr:protein translocase subunit SecD [Candidatus Niyogibacteria bacterium]